MALGGVPKRARVRHKKRFRVGIQSRHPLSRSPCSTSTRTRGGRTTSPTSPSLNATKSPTQRSHRRAASLRPQTTLSQRAVSGRTSSHHCHHQHQEHSSPRPPQSDASASLSFPENSVQSRVDAKDRLERKTSLQLASDRSHPGNNKSTLFQLKLESKREKKWTDRFSKDTSQYPMRGEQNVTNTLLRLVRSLSLRFECICAPASRRSARRPPSASPGPKQSEPVEPVMRLPFHAGRNFI
jgi:hypothetical protein